MLAFVLPRLLRQNDFTCARSVEAVAEQYQKHSNTAKLFLDKMLEYDPNGVIRKEDLWDTYQNFCSDKGLVLVSQKAFWSTFKEGFTQAVEQQYQENGVHKRNLKGVHFKKPDEEEDLEELSQKVTLEDYFNQDNQHNQDSGIFYAVYKVSKYIKEIKEKVGYVGDAGSLPEATAPSSNTILENHTSAALPGSNPIFQQGDEASPQSDGAALASRQPISADRAGFVATPQAAEAMQGIAWDGIQEGLRAGGLILGHQFEYAPEQVREALRGMAQAGAIFEPRPGSWRFVKPENEEVD